MVRAFLTHPVTRRSLALQAKGGQGLIRPVMQVMLGYSAIPARTAASSPRQWHLHRAQDPV
jgi:hypothetical protein